MKTKERYYFLDFIRLFVLIAIMTFHANEFIFYQDIFPMGWSSPLYESFSLLIARPLSLSGQILVGMTFFLFALNERKRNVLLKLSLFCLFGQFVLFMVFEKPEWDIYFYLGFVSFLISLTPNNRSFHKVSLTVSFFCLWLSPDWLKGLAPHSVLVDILVGRLSAHNGGSWPLLPWFFLPTLAYSLGFLLKDKKFLVRFNAFEFSFWLLLMILSIPFIGRYYWVPIGGNFYQYVFGQAPFIFWANFIVIIFLIRISFYPVVNQFFIDRKRLMFLCNLSWTRNVAICYILSLVYLGCGMSFEEYFLEHPKMFDLYFLGLFVSCELFCRLLLKIHSRYFLKEA